MISRYKQAKFISRVKSAFFYVFCGTMLGIALTGLAFLLLYATDIIENILR